MANAEINQIVTSASAVADADLYEIEQGSTSKKAAHSLIKTYVNNAPVWAAGSASANTWPKLTNGTILTTPEANALENDGTAFYTTLDTTNGRRQQCDQHIFRLTANGSALGPTIADFFGTNSALPTVTNGVYELTYHVYFLKTTAGSVTFTLTNTQTYTNLAGSILTAPSTGMGSFGSAGAIGIVSNTTAAAAFPATASLTAAGEYFALIRCTAECGTAGNIRLRVTSSAGTVTPRRGSYYTARRLFAGNVGTFAA